MMDLFPVEAKAESFYSNKLRVVPVLSDGMEPTLRGGVDWALIRPIDRYVGEGVYLIGRPIGSDFYRAASTLDGERTIRLWRDNDRYGEWVVTGDYFEENVLAIVVADVKVRDQRGLHEPA